MRATLARNSRYVELGDLSEWMRVVAMERPGARQRREHREKTERLFADQSRSIATEYLAKLHFHAEGGGQELQGIRKLRRRAIAPFYLPISQLKRSIYELARNLEVKGLGILLEEYVIKRDAQLMPPHRPRRPSTIDWTVRLVRRGAPNEQPRFLFDETTQSRMCTELNFAWHHGILPQYVTMFIREFGGFELLSARRAANLVDVTDDLWLDEILDDELLNWRGQIEKQTSSHDWPE